MGELSTSNAKHARGAQSHTHCCSHADASTHSLTTNQTKAAMATIDATSGITAAAAAQLRLDDLLRLLLTEFTHQNPLKPVENKDFMGQMAQFASLETTQQLN